MSNLPSVYMAEPHEARKQISLSGLAEILLLPSLIISMVLVNQPYLIAKIPGQIVGWVADLAAVFILLTAFRRKSWIFILVICIIITKTLRIGSMSYVFLNIYIILINILFCFAGAVIIFKRPNLVYKQMMVICLLNFIVMIFQVTGSGRWAQVLTTHGESNLESVSTLFVSEDNLQYLLIQGRPAGISYAGVILSLIILFGIVLHFSRSKGGYWWGTPMLCAMVVLCMAKMAFLGFFIMGLLVLLLGGARQKIRVLKATVLFILFLGLYAVIFPGLFSINLSMDTISFSFFIRANDIMAALSRDSPLIDILKPYLEGTSVASWVEEGEFVSGYASLLAKIYNNIVPIAMALAMCICIFIIGLRRLKKKFPELTVMIILTIFIIGLFPVTHPIWTQAVYWFMLGPVCLPFIYLLHPRFIAQKKNFSAIVFKMP